MISSMNGKEINPCDIWIISKGRYRDVELHGVDGKVETMFGKEYRISDLAKYMLNPNPVQVEKILVGCEIYYIKPFSGRVRERIKKVLPRRLCGLLHDRDVLPEILMSGFGRNRLSLKDHDLELYIENIYESLRPYNSLLRRLSRLDTDKISDITGICEDIDGKRSSLTLQGDIDKKIDYMKNRVSKRVGVILEKAHISGGLFEMRGFDFKSYDPNNSHRLLQLSNNGIVRHCVLDTNNRVEYWVNDIKLLEYVHLLEQSIRTDPGFNDSIKICTEGNAKPLKLLFYPQLKIDYSKTHLPGIYRRALETYSIRMEEKELIVDSLNHSLFGISFNYLPHSDSGEERLVTNISVMHDFKALGPIKDNLPLLYSEINKKTHVSEAGKFYLLDSIKGYGK